MTIIDEEMERAVANAISASGEGCLSGCVYVQPHEAARAAIQAALPLIGERCIEGVRTYYDGLWFKDDVAVETIYDIIRSATSLTSER